jgi:hypothetical protein
VSRPLSRLARARAGLAVLTGATLLGFGAVGCGGEIDVAPQDRPVAELFNQRCSGCHTLAVANSYGSKPETELEGGERTNGPNFDVRRVDRDSALFAIRNGGFSGAIMPANVVVGRDADRLARFLARYSGGQGAGSAAGKGAGPF